MPKPLEESGGRAETEEGSAAGDMGGVTASGSNFWFPFFLRFFFGLSFLSDLDLTPGGTSGCRFFVLEMVNAPSLVDAKQYSLAPPSISWKTYTRHVWRLVFVCLFDLHP